MSYRFSAPVQRVRQERKPTLKEIQEEHHFDAGALAAMAHVEPVVVEQMLQHRPVYKSQASKVLAALSKMRLKLYTVREIDVAMYRDEEVEQWRYR